MNRLVGLSLPALLSLLVGCGEEVEASKSVVMLPDLELSADQIDFGDLQLGEASTRTLIIKNNGDLPLGLESIVLLDEGFQQHFGTSWSPGGLVCPAGAVEAKRASTDSWDTSGGSSGGGSDGGGSDGGGSGGGADGGSDGGEEPSVAALVLDPGCTLPVTINFAPINVGQAFAAVQVTTVSEPVDPEGSETPAFYRDPDEFVQTVLLEGSASQGEGNIVVRSTRVDMGHHYPGESTSAYVYVHNVGDGRLEVAPPEIPVDPTTLERINCDAAFTLETSEMPRRELEPFEATLFSVRFEPTTLDPAFCEFTVVSDDADTPEVTVQLQGNAGVDPTEVAPTVAIRSPAPGYQHQTAEPLVMEIDMFDPNQPAETLICKVRSMLAATKVADCTPTDESGFVRVEIPYELLSNGTDSLVVSVTDQSELLARASTTVLWNARFPASDDDGDGFGDDPTETWVDCNDNDITIYPSAAELPDGKDNDCDGQTDEDTLTGDDDGDSVNEQDGDCDDHEPTTYPGAMEVPDGRDNDCDGIVDERTSIADDDGDGFTELDLDCDDFDATVNPAAIELCDGVDNNCNGLLDAADPLGCVATDAVPFVIGGVQMTRTALGPGEATTLSVFVYDADGDALSFSWTEDSALADMGYSGYDSTTAQTVVWTAPELPEGSTGAIYDVSVLVTDPDGNSDWAFGQIWVFPEAVSLSQEVLDGPAAEGEKGGCGGSDSSAALLLVGVGGLALIRRRRSR